MKDHWTVKLAMSGKEQTQTLAPNASSAAYVTFTTRPVGATTGFRAHPRYVLSRRMRPRL